VIEFEHNRVRLAAVNARVRLQVLINEPGSAFALKWIIATVALDVHGVICAVMVLRPAAVALLALAVLLAGSLVLHGKLLRFPRNTAAGAGLSLPPHSSMIEHVSYTLVDFCQGRIASKFADRIASKFADPAGQVCLKTNPDRKQRR
jgi:hypothetical protein